MSSTLAVRARLLTLVAAIALFIVPSTASAVENTLTLEGENFTSPSGVVLPNGQASGGHVLALYGPQTATITVNGTAGWLGVRLAGTACRGYPRARITINGRTVADTEVTGNGNYVVYPTDFRATTGRTSQTIGVTFTNDYKESGCDRNLFIDHAWFVTDQEAPRTRLYVDPDEPAMQQAEAWASTRPADAALMRKLGSKSVAKWVGHWSGDSTVLNKALDNAEANAARIVLVVYGIPFRDAGGYSAGGHETSDEYKRWIDWIAQTIGSRPALTIVEPDAVTMDVETWIRGERDAMLRYATQRLNSLSDNMVYLDAGNEGWRTADAMVPRLRSAGVANADGISVNVSNFLKTSTELKYAFDIRRALGGDPHIVVDTSRNGNGPATGAVGEAAWCNPAGRAVGVQPTMGTGVDNVDAFVWAKRPGASDGACRGFPAAGTFMPQVALDLIRGASW